MARSSKSSSRAGDPSDQKVKYLEETRIKKLENHQHHHYNRNGSRVSERPSSASAGQKFIGAAS